MGRFLILIGLLALALDFVADSARSLAPLGLGLVLAGGFLHLSERR